MGQWPPPSGRARCARPGAASRSPSPTASSSKIRGDADDVFSHGFLCPKGTSLKALHEDPDRLRTPLVRGADGVHREATWDEAFAEIDRRLPPLVAEHGPNSVAAYLGNPAAHGLGPLMYGRVLLKAIGTRNVFSASTVDQFPKQLASGLMFGTGLTVAVPDVDRTDHLLILGANPMASNGSLLTAPDMRGRLRAIRERGGKVVVIDPRRTRTAEEADEHHFIVPGTDALLLMALVHVLFDEGLADPGALAEHVEGIDAVRELAAGFAPADVGRGDRDRRRRHRAHGPRARRGADRGGLRAHRHDDAALRHHGELARRRAQRADRQPRPPRRRDVHEARRGLVEHAAASPGAGAA